MLPKPLLNVLKLMVFIVTALSGTELFPEDTNQNLNLYYRFPFSMGLEYQYYSYFGENRGNNNISGLDLQIHFPLYFRPEFQPLMELGFINCDYLDPNHTEKLDHYQFYTLVGLGYANRFAKNFEYGIEIAGGAGLSVFPNVINNEQMTSSIDLIGETGVYFSLSPTYNFTISFHPNLKYFSSLSPLTIYNGFVLGIGGALHYRFGNSPDLPFALLNSLTMTDVDLPPVFANLNSYYANHPIGKFKLTNAEHYPVTNIEVTFSQKTYLDSPSCCARISELKPGESRDVELYATFNNQIFTIEGSEPVNGELRITYKGLGRASEQKKSVPFELNDKTTIVWNDYRKLAALITPADSALKNYCSFVQRGVETEMSGEFNRNLQSAMLLYHALSEFNLVYQPDPVLPFTVIKSGEKEGTTVKDRVYLARDTLKRGSGDCDDLTVLFCSLLECIGIETGYIIIPGHIFPVFNTGEPASSAADLDPLEEMTIPCKDELWIPVEVTLLGQTNFHDAWRKGIEEYRLNMQSQNLYLTREAQREFQPVDLKEKNLGLEHGDITRIKQNYKVELDRIIHNVLAGYEQKCHEKADKILLNRLGSLYGYLKNFNTAEESFKKALALDGDYLYAKLNLGILLARKKEYKQALVWFNESEKQVNKLAAKYPEQIISGIYTNIAQCYLALGNESQALVYDELAGKTTAKLGDGAHLKTSGTLNKDQKSIWRFVHE